MLSFTLAQVQRVLQQPTDLTHWLHALTAIAQGIGPTALEQQVRCTDMCAESSAFVHPSTQVLPLARALLPSASATRRSTAAALLGCAARGLSVPALHELVLPPLLDLCQDTEGLVRQAACAQLPLVATRMPSAACVAEEIDSLLKACRHVLAIRHRQNTRLHACMTQDEDAAVCAAALVAAAAMPSPPPCLLPLCTTPPDDPLIAQCLAKHAQVLYSLALHSPVVNAAHLAAGLVSLLDSPALLGPESRVAGLAAVGAVAGALGDAEGGVACLLALLERLGVDDECGEVRGAAWQAVPGLAKEGLWQECCLLLLKGMQVLCVCRGGCFAWRSTCR